MTKNLYDIDMRTIEGNETKLGDYRGQVLLIVNVASKCGLTPQYEALERLHERYEGQGLRVLGFPANDFLEQEPGSDAEIAEFCTTRYNVQFPMFSKISVTGPEKHRLYRHLQAEAPATRRREEMEQSLAGYNIQATEPPEVVWNFEKALVNRDGDVVCRYSPTVTPEDQELVSAIEAALTRD